MTNREFEEKMKTTMIDTYIKVMGAEKWNRLTDKEKDSLLHIMTKAVVEPMLAAI